MKLKAQVLQQTKRLEDRLNQLMAANRKLQEQNVKLVKENRRLLAIQSLRPIFDGSEVALGEIA